VPPWIAGEQIEPYPLPDAREPARDAPDTTAGTLEPADFSAPIGVRDPAPAPSFMSDDTPGANVAAFLELIRQIEARGRYDVIAGNDRFSDFSEHPFILDPRRRRPLGTTASGAYQMIKSTWIAARDALGLPDFSPASQDAAAVWILQFKRPRAWPLVQQGRFHEALKALRNEWEAFDKMIAGTYPINLARAQAIYEQAGGIVA
jgi:lysozyme